MSENFENDAAVLAIEARVMEIKKQEDLKKEAGDNLEENAKKKESKVNKENKPKLARKKKMKKKVVEKVEEAITEKKKEFDYFSCLSSEKCARGYCHLFEQKIVSMCSNKRY